MADLKDKKIDMAGKFYTQNSKGGIGASPKNDQAAKGNEVKDRQAKGNKVASRMAVDRQGKVESFQNASEVKRFDKKPSYKGKDGKGSLESVQNGKDMYLAGNEHNRS